MRFILSLILALSPICFGWRADINKDGRVDYLDLQILAMEWMEGTDMFSSEAVTNGTFDTDTGWTKGDGWSINTTTKKAVFLNAGSAGDLQQAFTILPGYWKVSYTVSGCDLGVGDYIKPYFAGQAGTNRSTDNTFTEYFTVSTTSTAGIEFSSYIVTAGKGCSIDSVTAMRYLNYQALWEDAIYTTLMADANTVALIGDNVFQSYTNPGVSKPYLIYEQIATDRDHTFDGASGLATIKVQFSIFGTSYTNARTIADAVRRKLDGYYGTVSITGDTCKILQCHLVDDGDLSSERADNVIMYGKRQDYEIVIDEKP